MLTGRQVPSGQFDTIALDFITRNEKPALAPTLNASDIPVIGYGYPLLQLVTPSGKPSFYEVNPHLAADFAGIHTFSPAEMTLLHNMANDLTAGDPTAAKTLFGHRASTVLHFTITGGSPGDNAETLFKAELSHDVAAAHLTTIASNPDMANTYELAALEDIAFHNPSAIYSTPGFLTDISTGARITAWYDIVAGMDAGPTNCLNVENQLIRDADEFGLYSGGHSTTSIKEAIAVHHFLDSHQTLIENYMLATGELTSTVNSFIAASYSPANNELLHAFGEKLTIPTTNIFVEPTSLPAITSGDALIVGGAGKHSLSITGADADAVILFVANGGTYTIGTAQVTSPETLDIESSPGTVNVTMGKLETLKIDHLASFKGTISGFQVGNEIDLVGISAVSATPGAGNVLSIKESDGTILPLHLNPKANYALDEFQVASDNNGGTAVTVHVRPPTDLTFSEFPVDTTITNQYQSEGVVFSGGDFIADDGADPTSPALSGSPLYSGPIHGQFVDYYTGAQGTVKTFSFDAGYFNSLHSTKITWYNAAGGVIGSETNAHLGYEHFNITSKTPIASFTVAVVGQEASGFSFDNLKFGHVTG